ncbi:hypothetical protein RHMOL_Rhmol12G0128800 [Rhododendron molle]|uniref:Uncharacterized protein n=1 Tax=Rhododendron molle TaxID=49168 RepID=A0ACC0LJ08_RHOML|nr:hypothetical protein RHMOL_Rhmol12G0128800 [Rhododendron molle]
MSSHHGSSPPRPIRSNRVVFFILDIIDILPFHETLIRRMILRSGPMAEITPQVLENAMGATKPLLKVINVHKATKNMVSLIPHILSNVAGIKVTEVDWGRGTIDVPVVSKLQILAT